MDVVVEFRAPGRRRALGDLAAAPPAGPRRRRRPARRGRRALPAHRRPDPQRGAARVAARARRRRRDRSTTHVDARRAARVPQGGHGLPAAARRRSPVASPARDSAPAPPARTPSRLATLAGGPLAGRRRHRRRGAAAQAGRLRRSPSSLGVDASPVRVHSDANAIAVTESLGARAFAFGSHVFLGPRRAPDRPGADGARGRARRAAAGRAEAPALHDRRHGDATSARRTRRRPRSCRGEPFTVRERTAAARPAARDQRRARLLRRQGEHHPGLPDVHDRPRASTRST